MHYQAVLEQMCVCKLSGRLSSKMCAHKILIGVHEMQVKVLCWPMTPFITNLSYTYLYESHSWHFTVVVFVARQPLSSSCMTQTLYLGHPVW